MEEYKLLCFVLFTLIIGSQTWPQNNREKATDSNQSKATMRKAAMAGGAVDDGDGITFPDDEMPHARPPRTDFSAEGKGVNCTEGICEKAHDYPYAYVEQIVKQLRDGYNLSGEFVGNFVNSGSRTRPEGPEENYLCETLVHTSYPQSIKNDQNVSRYIVNDGKSKQGVIYVTCVSDKCDKDASFPVGYEAKCIQKYSKVRLLAIQDEGNPTYDTFVVPSCCVCAFTKPKH